MTDTIINLAERRLGHSGASRHTMERQREAYIAEAVSALEKASAITKSLGDAEELIQQMFEEA